MAYWLFQTHPNQYLLSASLAFLSKEPWPVNQHREELQPGDLVFFGMVGSNEGVYALGRIAQAPGEFEYPFGEVQSFWLDEDIILDNSVWVWIEYLTKIHEEPLMRKHLNDDPELAALPCFTEEPGDFQHAITESQARKLLQRFPGRIGGDKLPEDARALMAG